MVALLTGAVGTENVMNAGVAAGVKNVVVLSTDKAAYPVNTCFMMSIDATRNLFLRALESG